MWYIQHVKQPNKRILTIKTSIRQPALFISPFRQAAIVKMLLAVLNDKRNDIMSQAFLQRNKPSDSSVSILEWVYRFEFRMKSNHIVDCDSMFPVIISLVRSVFVIPFFRSCS